MPLNWVDGKGINPNAPTLPVAGGQIVPNACLVAGDTLINIGPSYAPLPSPMTLGQPRQGCG